MVKIAVAVYSTYGHILTLAKAEAEGVKAGGAQVDVFQLPSGEPNDASAASDLPVLTPSKLMEYDGVLFGIPSRFGTHPYAFKAFFDATGAQWAQGSFHGKYASFFVTSGTQGGGQESVIRNSVTILAHHGILYVPLGYGRAFGEITNLNEVHGGSPWGAGSFAGPSGARQPSTLELDTARIQGKSFAETVIKGTGQGASSGSTGAAAAAATGTAGAGAAAGASQNASSAPAAGKSAPQATQSTTAPAATEAKTAATEAPKKAEAAEASATRAEQSAEKESEGCCKCM